MAESAAERAAAVEQVLRVTEGENTEVQLAALNAIQPPTQRRADELWTYLVLGLLGLLLVSLVGILVLLIDGDGDAVDKALIPFSALLGAVVGLFARSPVDGPDTGGR
jgi:hypothetical protein